jgi:hypothetical protein
MFRIPLLALLLSGCGVDESGKATVVGQPIDTKSPEAGPMGPKGDRGSDGVNGKDGVDGKDGAQGIQGEAGEATSANMWHDPITKRDWLFGASQAFSATVCLGDYRLPTAAEAITAIQHGIYAAATTANAPHVSIWTSDVYTDSLGSQFPVRATTVSATPTGDLSTQLHGLYCIKK